MSCRINIVLKLIIKYGVMKMLALKMKMKLHTENKLAVTEYILYYHTTSFHRTSISATGKNAVMIHDGVQCHPPPLPAAIDTWNSYYS